MSDVRNWISQVKKRKNLLFLYLYGLVEPSADWVMSTHVVERFSLLSLLIQMLISSKSTLTDIPRNNILPTL